MWKPRNPHRINDEIRALRVRVVGEGIQQGIYPLNEALAIAERAELDLVEIAPGVDPPVCKVIDYKKFLYNHKKKQKEIKAKTAKVIVKEIRFGPNTDEHDYNFKLRHAINFLQDGAKLKTFVFFKGRSIIYKEKGEALLHRLAKDLELYGEVEQSNLKMEGKRMIMMVNPARKKK